MACKDKVHQRMRMRRERSISSRAEAASMRGLYQRDGESLCPVSSLDCSSRNSRHLSSFSCARSLSISSGVPCQRAPEFKRSRIAAADPRLNFLRPLRKGRTTTGVPSGRGAGSSSTTAPSLICPRYVILHLRLVAPCPHYNPEIAPIASTSACAPARRSPC